GHYERGEQTEPRVAAVVFAVNDRHPMPGIVHPWNFWSATTMAQRSTLSFDRPYVLYDLLEGGREIRLDQKEAGRFVLPVTFDRCAGRAYIATTAPIRQVRVRTYAATDGGPVPVAADVLDDKQRVFQTPLPF